MILVTADLHFTDHPKDEYRFGIFEWLVAQSWIHRIGRVYVLGDLTEKKDRHSASLVKKIINGFELLREKAEVTVLMGNHDFIDIESPFFEFINHIDCVRFIADPQETDQGIYCVPYQPDQYSFDASLGDMEVGDGVFIHQMIDGAIGDTGARLTGFNTATLAAKRPKWVFSGDIHTPQRVGIVEYVGSPYMTRFGVPYTPRVLLLDTETGNTQNLYFPAPRKLTLTIRSPDELLTAGVEKDHVKVILELPRSELTTWPTQKQRIVDICRELGCELYGAELKPQRRRERITAEPSARTDGEVFNTFCKAEKVPPRVKQAGQAIMEVDNDESVESS